MITEIQKNYWKTLTLEQLATHALHRRMEISEIIDQIEDLNFELDCHEEELLFIRKLMNEKSSSNL